MPNISNSDAFESVTSARTAAKKIMDVNDMQLQNETMTLEEAKDHIRATNKYLKKRVHDVLSTLEFAPAPLETRLATRTRSAASVLSTGSAFVLESSQTAIQTRQELDTAITERADLYETEAYSAIIDLPVGMAKIIIEESTQEQNELQCIIHKYTKKEHYGSVNLNKREGLFLPGSTTEKYPYAKYYLHHIAMLLKKGGRKKLMSVLKEKNPTNPRLAKQEYEISHLCNNSHCINHEHLEVEPKKDNQDRNSCNGHRIVEFIPLNEKVFTLDPCIHRKKNKIRKSCILPTVRVRESVRKLKSQRHICYNLETFTGDN